MGVFKYISKQQVNEGLITIRRKRRRLYSYHIKSLITNSKSVHLIWNIWSLTKYGNFKLVA